MVKDIVSGAANGNPQHLTAIGNTLYFSAADNTHLTELWKSDGTSSGTVMVKDINSASLSSSYPQYLTAIGNTLYFQASDGTNGYELWKSDGTSSGTVMVKDIMPGSTGGTPLSSSPSRLTAVGNTLYFRATDYTHGYELWSAELTFDGSGVIVHHDITYS
jgi:ELWxxDGT repeat protein